MLLVFDVPVFNRIFRFKRNKVKWHGVEFRNVQNTDGEIQIWQA